MHLCIPKYVLNTLITELVLSGGETERRREGEIKLNLLDILTQQTNGKYFIKSENKNCYEYIQWSKSAHAFVQNK